MLSYMCTLLRKAKQLPNRKDTSWEFFKDAHGYWHWRRLSKVGKVLKHSKQGFRDKAECFDHARLHGYKG